MNDKITPQDIANYQENGFLIIDDFLNAEEVEIWRDAVDHALKNRNGRKFPHSEIKTGESDGINDDTGGYFGKVFDQVINLWMTDDKMKELIFDERIGKMAAELAQVNGIRVWHDQALIKRPWANPTAWHLDTPFWSFSHRQALSIWIALDDVTIQNGCLYFLPGTHKETQFDEPGIAASIGDIFDTYPQFAQTSPVASVIKAGSCSFHNGLNIHAAGPNMTTGFRRAMTCAFMPDGSTFNGKKNVLPNDYFETLKVGDVLDNDAQNPLIYSRG
ncbi:MAG TPA: phytanoyl-CoA dioxygenase family protein [Saprospiraceae bacterium]|nr:phytanoyl-CoA dioxygenase family protein [Saprospiraceae bacterium]